MPLCSLDEALADLAAGKLLILVDDEDRENEGDLVMLADMATPEAVNFITTYARGLVCMPMMGERLDELDMPLMVSANSANKQQTAFTVSVDYKNGTTTGISAFDRAATIRALADPNSKAGEFNRPGHLFPLRYHPAASWPAPATPKRSSTCVNLIGKYPAGIVCEIMNEDGSMARMEHLEEFAQVHELNILSIAQIVAHRRRTEKLVERVAEARLPTRYGDFKAIAYRSTTDPGEHIALTIGEWEEEQPVLTRIHSECLTGDVFGSLRCDCGEQLELALKILGDAGVGVLLYMRQEGRGIGLHNKIKAYSLQDTGLDTIEANQSLGFDADERNYGNGAQILLDLGVRKVRLLTNNPTKMMGLSGFDLDVVERVPVEASVTDENRRYLTTKRSRMGHILGNC